MTAKLAEITPAVLSLPDAARYLGISVRTLQAMKQQGDIQFVYITSHPGVKVADLDALVEQAPTSRPGAA